MNTVSSKRRVLRSISVAVSQVFLLQQIAFAAPSVTLPVNTVSNQTLKVSFDTPESVVMVDETFNGGSDKTIILIQDAHTNDSSQINIAKTLDNIVKEEGLKYIFLEAGTGDNSLSYLRNFGTREKRYRVALSYLRKGVLQGAEYFDITSNRDVRLWGVENKALYDQSLQVYKNIIKHREHFEAYFSKIQNAISYLKPNIFNPSLKSFDDQYQKLLKAETPVTQYFGFLLDQAKRHGVSVKNNSALKHLLDIQELESRIDFASANEEQIRAINSLPGGQKKKLISMTSGNEKPGPGRVSMETDKSLNAFYSLLEEKLDSNAVSEYPNLYRYFEYLHKAGDFGAKEVLREQKELEARIYAKLTTNRDERKLIQSALNIESLRSIFDLRATPHEFAVYTKNMASFDIERITAFLNKKIHDLKKNYEKVLFIDPLYDEVLNYAEAFYNLTYRRDKVFIQSVIEKMDLEDESKSVLITGGFHTPNLKALLKDRDVSYISLTPQVFHPTDSNRYEKILLGQYRPDTPIYSDSKIALLPQDSTANTIGIMPNGDGANLSSGYSWLYPIALSIASEAEKSEALAQTTNLIASRVDGARLAEEELIRPIDGDREEGYFNYVVSKDADISVVGFLTYLLQNENLLLSESDSWWEGVNRHISTIGWKQNKKHKIYSIRDFAEGRFEDVVIPKDTLVTVSFQNKLFNAGTRISQEIADLVIHKLTHSGDLNRARDMHTAEPVLRSYMDSLSRESRDVAIGQIAFLLNNGRRKDDGWDVNKMRATNIVDDLEQEISRTNGEVTAGDVLKMGVETETFVGVSDILDAFMQRIEEPWVRVGGEITSIHERLESLAVGKDGLEATFFNTVLMNENSKFYREAVIKVSNRGEEDRFYLYWMHEDDALEFRGVINKERFLKRFQYGARVSEAEREILRVKDGLFSRLRDIGAKYEDSLYPYSDGFTGRVLHDAAIIQKMIEPFGDLSLAELIRQMKYSNILSQYRLSKDQNGITDDLPVTYIFDSNIVPNYNLRGKRPRFIAITVNGDLTEAMEKKLLGAGDKPHLLEDLDLAGTQHYKNIWWDVWFDGGKNVFVAEGDNFVAVTSVFSDAINDEDVFAKGGNRWYAYGETSHKQKKGILEKWVASSISAGALLGFYVTGPDVYMGNDEMGWIVDQANDTQYQLDVAETPILATTSRALEKGGFNHIVWKATSIAVVESFMAVLDHTRMREYLDIPETVTIAIQGFGDVGQGVIRHLWDNYKDKLASGKIKIIAVTDSKGGVENQEGLDIEELLRMIPLRDEINEKRKTDASVKRFSLMEQYSKSHTKITNPDDVLFKGATVNVPAAMPDVITTPEQVREMARRGTKIYGEGANNSFTPGIGLEEEFFESGILLQAGNMVNGGGIFASTEEFYHSYLDGRAIVALLKEEVRNVYNRRLHVQSGIMDLAFTNATILIDEFLRREGNVSMYDINEELVNKMHAAKKNLLDKNPPALISRAKLDYGYRRVPKRFGRLIAAAEMARESIAYSDQSVVEIVKELEEPSSVARLRFAIYVLGKMRLQDRGDVASLWRDKVVKILRKIVSKDMFSLESEDSYPYTSNIIRRTAAEALGQLGDNEALSVLEAVINNLNEDQPLRVTARWAQEKIQDIESLQNNQHESGARFSDTASDPKYVELIKTGKFSENDLLEMLESDDSTVTLGKHNAPRRVFEHQAANESQEYKVLLGGLQYHFKVFYKWINEEERELDSVMIRVLDLSGEVVANPRHIDSADMREVAGWLYQYAGGARISEEFARRLKAELNTQALLEARVTVDVVDLDETLGRIEPTILTFLAKEGELYAQVQWMDRSEFIKIRDYELDSSEFGSVSASISLNELMMAIRLANRQEVNTSLVDMTIPLVAVLDLDQFDIAGLDLVTKEALMRDQMRAIQNAFGPNTVVRLKSQNPEVMKIGESVMRQLDRSDIFYLPKDRLPAKYNESNQIFLMNKSRLQQRIINGSLPRETKSVRYLVFEDIVIKDGKVSLFANDLYAKSIEVIGRIDFDAHLDSWAEFFHLFTKITQKKLPFNADNLRRVQEALYVPVKAREFVVPKIARIAIEAVLRALRLTDRMASTSV